MPAEYSIEPGRRLVRSRGWGTLSLADVVAHYHAIAADPAFDPMFDQLADLRDVDEFSISSTQIREDALDAIFAPSARRAFVASSDVAFGLARMYGLQAEGAQQNVQVFRALAEAERWLGLPPPP
jgi:hypothetical protein